MLIENHSYLLLKRRFAKQNKVNTGKFRWIQSNANQKLQFINKNEIRNSWPINYDANSMNWAKSQARIRFSDNKNRFYIIFDTRNTSCFNFYFYFNEFRNKFLMDLNEYLFKVNIFIWLVCSDVAKVKFNNLFFLLDRFCNTCYSLKLSE